MKCAYNLSKFCKLSKNFIYEETEKYIAVADNGGTVGIVIMKPEYQDKNGGILEQIRAKNKQLTERQGFAELLNKHITTKEETYTMIDTHITFPTLNYGTYTQVTALKAAESNYMKYADIEKLSIFDYDLAVTTEDRFSAITLICTNCYGIVMPMRVSGENSNRAQELMDIISADLKVK